MTAGSPQCMGVMHGQEAGTQSIKHTAPCTHPRSASASARRLRALPCALKEGVAQPAASNSSPCCSAAGPPPAAAMCCPAVGRRCSSCCSPAALKPACCGALAPGAALLLPPSLSLLGTSKSGSSSERSTKRATLPQSTPRSISSGSSLKSCTVRGAGAEGRRVGNAAACSTSSWIVALQTGACGQWQTERPCPLAGRLRESLCGYTSGTAHLDGGGGIAQQGAPGLLSDAQLDR